MNDEITTMSQANAAQLHKLANRLSELGLIDLNDDDPDEEIGIAFVNDVETGEITVAIDTGESMYWEAGRQLIEQREGRGRMLYRRLDDQGDPIEDWRNAPPPPSRSAGN